MIIAKIMNDNVIVLANMTCIYILKSVNYNCYPITRFFFLFKTDEQMH